VGRLREAIRLLILSHKYYKRYALFVAVAILWTFKVKDKQEYLVETFIVQLFSIYNVAALCIENTLSIPSEVQHLHI
jgi:hypothetical protein